MESTAFTRRREFRDKGQKKKNVFALLLLTLASLITKLADRAKS